MQVAIAHYIRFKYKDGTYVPARAYQNFFVSEIRSFQSVSYQFAPFRISGVISNKGGDTAQANITTVPNSLTVGVATESVLNYWMVEIQTIVINATTLAPETGNQLIGVETGSFTEVGVLATELWMCGNLTQDYEKITISLMSPLDATRKQVPNRVLSETLVGKVPPTGTIYAS
jgi:hypothetical protein